ncbi:MAG: YdcF family protein [Lachnospiraceae bacterium]|nr:YdcF family protein [Lachnospiraceae bacterium]
MWNKAKLTVLQRIGIFVRLMIGISFCALLILFIIPVLYGIVNIGGICGIIFCLAMIFVTLSYSTFNTLTDKIKQHKAGRVFMRIILAVFVIGVVYVCFLTGLIIAADHTPPQYGATVIVLGCQVQDESPSLMLKARIDAAYDYLTENPGAVCIVSGGKGDGEHLSEAQCMYNNLTEMGISSERIYLEDRSVNTKENIKFSKEIISEKGLSENTAIVTDIFHQYRASDIVKSNGLTYGSVPADCVWYLIPTYYVRELIAITATFFGLA